MHTTFRALLFFCCTLVPAARIWGQDLKLDNLTGTHGGNLVAAVTKDPANFNRLFASGLADIAVVERLSADLVHINRNTLQLEPALAVSWEPDNTGRVYTIRLRRGVRFSDGSPFTADDVVFTFQVLTDPKIETTMAAQIETDGAFPSVKKIDDYTVALTFKHTVGMGLRMLDSVPIIPRKRLWKAYREGRLPTAWGATADPSEVVGLGPFRLKEYQSKTRIVLERNPYYWKVDKAGRKLPYLDTITYLVIPDLNSEALRFQNGEIDLVSSPSLNPENYASLRRSCKGCTVQNLGAGLMVDYLWFNLNGGRDSKGKPYVDPEKKAIFDKPDFRRAVSYAINRPAIARSVFLGLGVPQYGMVSSGNREWHNPGIPRTEYNPAHARKMLEGIGLRDGNRYGFLEYGTRLLPLEFTVITQRGHQVRERMIQVIQDNLSKVGIRMRTQLLLQNEIASRFLTSFQYEAILFGFMPTDVAPDLQTDLWYSSGPIHFWHPSQKKPAFPWESTVDALISKLVTSRDPKVRKTSFDQAQVIWATEMPAIPTVASNILVGWSNRLGNVRPSIIAPHLVWNAEEITKRTQ